MLTFPLGSSELQVPAVVAGMMRIEDLSDEAIRELFDAARESGVTFFDHADIYGSAAFHGCEARFGEALALTPSQRDEITIQSKAGIIKGSQFNFSYDHITAQVEGSLKALRTDRLDVLLLHRPDTLVEPEEVARAFDDLHAAGKVLHFGVSNHTPNQIDLLKRFVTRPIVANQVQLSITHAPIIAGPMNMNMVAEDESIDRDHGILDYCRINDITLQAWSPFQAGFFDGVFLGNPRYPELNTLIDALALQYNVPAEAIATAWITRHPAKMQVVLGTTSPDRLRASALGADLALTRTQWYDLYRAAGHRLP